MGLFKKIAQSYKQSQQESKEFFARVEADNRRKAAAGLSSAQIQRSPKKYVPPFSFIGAPAKIGDMTQAYRYGYALIGPNHVELKKAFDADQYLFDIELADGITYVKLNGSRVGASGFSRDARARA